MVLFSQFKPRHRLLSRREMLAEDVDHTGAVFHLDISSDGLSEEYRPGDVFGVFPKNAPGDVEAFIQMFRLDPDEVIRGRHASQPVTWREYLSNYVDLRKIHPVLADRSPNAYKQNEHMGKLTLLECVRYHTIDVSSAQLLSALSPLTPRFYSIASSPLFKQDVVELIVRHVRYHGGYDYQDGICSSFLCSHLVEGDVCMGFVRRSRDFVLDERHQGKPLVMIGSGTGIAPFRGFVQHRMALQDRGPMILFFGERYAEKNCYYRDFWKEYQKQLDLQLFFAFSREGDEKQYVQDLLYQQRSELVRLMAQGAYFFICGSKHMGSEVKISLESILGSPAYCALRSERRLLVDVY